ncbi:uncharacterized protein DSM5745_04540 [Aspergillus mulundensis]|uniref:Uncharacterized protein n=1 Tax=Aspergillus mulundensis TaxID=1810919 RepID=A0A3D8SDN1_9EURO|nr:hypothetical protein DSM5745_04540 [Aspergillus mulundensis]RDW84214.1 hypothetical protein DSM5745_04540 [Aspergillus mulundensis]
MSISPFNSAIRTEVTLSSRVGKLVEELKNRYPDITSTSLQSLSWSIEHLMTAAVSMMCPGPAGVTTIFESDRVRHDFDRFTEWLKATNLENPNKWTNYSPIPYHLRPLSILAPTEPIKESTTQRTPEANASRLILRSQMWDLQRQMFQVMDVLVVLAQGAEENKGEDYMVNMCSSELAPALRQVTASIKLLWQEAELAWRFSPVEDNTESPETDSTSDAETVSLPDLTPPEDLSETQADGVNNSDSDSVEMFTSDSHGNGAPWTDLAATIMHEDASPAGRKRARNKGASLRHELTTHLSVLSGHRLLTFVRAVNDSRFHAVVLAHLDRIHDAVKPIVQVELSVMLRYILQERGIEYLEHLIPNAEREIRYDRDMNGVENRAWTTELFVSGHADRAHWANKTFCVLRQHFRALGIWRD